MTGIICACSTCIERNRLICGALSMFRLNCSTETIFERDVPFNWIVAHTLTDRNENDIWNILKFVQDILGIEKKLLIGISKIYLHIYKLSEPIFSFDRSLKKRYILYEWFFYYLLVNNYLLEHTWNRTGTRSFLCDVLA